MVLMLVLFGAGAGVELFLHTIPVVWRVRTLVAIVALLLTAFASGMLVMWRPNAFSVLLALIGLYRVFNDIRIVEARMHERYLQRVTRRTALALIGLQMLMAAWWFMVQSVHTTGYAAILAATVAQFGVAVLLFGSTLRGLQRTAWPTKITHLSDEELPTLTVAIPARNETEDLQACLQNLVANDYPKLEIMVLDDCSQTRRTPEIIRQFAHDGVRFVAGEPPEKTWLPKNQAYDHLAREANGEYILFTGVDVRFEQTSLRRIVGTLLYKKKQMMSILPERAPGARSSAALAQGLRYFWELVPPRRLFRRPPVLSSCWIMQREALQKSGGFGAVARSIVPEAHFAKLLTPTDGYSFMRAGLNPGVQSLKNAGEQRATAIRTRYPQLHRRPENVLIISGAELFFLVLPFVLAVGSVWLEVGIVAQVLAITTSILLVVTYELVGLSTKISSWWFGLVALPAMVLYDLAILHYSMWQYEFSEVDWKGRNICIPAMHVIPHLPKI